MSFKSNIKKNRFLVYKKTVNSLTGVLLAVVIAVAGSGLNTAQAATAEQVSTGSSTACAVVSSKVKCWGYGGYGQLGNGSTSNSSTPVSISTALIGTKAVSKVSVGATHACALADARVYCWGNNASGQLGNRTTTTSNVPVAVDIQSKDVTPAPYTTPTPCGGPWYTFQPACQTVTPVMKPKSALGGKEIIDVAAGDSFTCALASDGSVSCWGEGENGRLGTNSTTDSNYPVAIYTQDVFNGKKGVKLSKVSGATMCVLAIDATSSVSTAQGSPYCWGYGIDDGTALPANGVSTVPCSKSTPTSRPATSTLSYTTIFQSLKPVSIPGTSFAALDTGNYATGQGTDGRAYYWGMYGFTENSTISNVTSCVVNPCTSRIQPKIELALTSSQQKAKAANTGGGDKNKNLNSNKSALGLANNAANGYTNATSYSATNSNAGSYQGTATPAFGYYAGSGSSTGGGGATGNSCASQTHYGYTKNGTYSYVGQKVATTPPAWSSTQAGLSAVSGNVFNGLYCATNGATTNCDAHGTSVNEGQTGSNYTQQCVTTGFIFTQTTCTTPPTGPQQVVSNGWLAGKLVSSLDTGKSGYTCAIASGAVGCWGINTYGQLGVGSTANKNVPTAVGNL